ncbi:alpha/beta fold hydrolase [Spirillospora sp. CA-128828]|uniref:alpha/beta fold hydrolase n=1 Tax=Spirillospora sp. CA-128828 TaxID=3240033 RepID=UPI003D909974
MNKTTAKRPARPRALAVLALAGTATAVWAGVPATQAAPAAARTDTTCPRPPGLETTCGTIQVPLDRAAPASGETTVRYMLVRHRGTAPAAGTVALNDGGPGNATIVGLAQRPQLLPGVFGKILDTHDMLLMDPRGTGGSDAQRCEDLSIDAIPATRSGLLDAVRGCGRELGKRSRHYTSAATADDFDAVRAHLGIGQLDLLGESYGSYLMTVYAQRHPGHVRSIVLSSAYPLEFDMWARPNAQAMRQAIKVLCERSAGKCDGDQVLAGLGTLAGRLRARPVPYESAGAERVLDDTALAAITYDAAGDRELMGRLPGVVRASLKGDYGPLTEVAGSRAQPALSDRLPRRREDRQSGQADEQLYGLTTWASVICNDYPTLWDRQAPVPARTREYERARRRLASGAFAPFTARAWTNGIYDRGNFCLRWPDRKGPVQPTDRPLPGVPVLVLSGELDANTPTAEGRAAARQYPRAQVIEIPNTGHVAEFDEQANPCVMELQSEFFRTGRVTGTGCLAEIPPIPVE